MGGWTHIIIELGILAIFICWIVIASRKVRKEEGEKRRKEQAEWKRYDKKVREVAKDVDRKKKNTWKNRKKTPCGTTYQNTRKGREKS